MYILLQTASYLKLVPFRRLNGSDLAGTCFFFQNFGSLEFFSCSRWALSPSAPGASKIIWRKEIHLKVKHHQKRCNSESNCLCKSAVRMIRVSLCYWGRVMLLISLPEATPAVDHRVRGKTILFYFPSLCPNILLVYPTLLIDPWAFRSCSVMLVRLLAGAFAGLTLLFQVHFVYDSLK